MDRIGVRDLKAHLSACLKRVKAGERLVVTDRGRAVAVLAPVGSAPALDWVDTLVAEGQVDWSGGKPAGLAARIPSRGRSASGMVIEDRR